MIIQHSTNITGCYYTKYDVYSDARGQFAEIYKLSNNKFCVNQINYSLSKKLVLRGLHKAPYAKFVTCIVGSIYDVCLDLREKSETYMQHFGIILSPQSINSIYIPANCAHGFMSLEDSVVVYAQDGEYNKDLDETYCYSHFNINWPYEPEIISQKDKTACLAPSNNE